MFAFAGMLVSAAEAAGMKVPPDPENFIPGDYPHFAVFCTMQLGAPMPYAGVHFENAKIIAAIPDDKIKKLKAKQIFALGFQVGSSHMLFA